MGWNMTQTVFANVFSNLIKWHRSIIRSVEKPFSLIKLFCLGGVDRVEVKRGCLTLKCNRVGSIELRNVESRKEKGECCRLLWTLLDIGQSHKVYVKWQPKCKPSIWLLHNISSSLFRYFFMSSTMFTFCSLRCRFYCFSTDNFVRSFITFFKKFLLRLYVKQ